MVTLVFVKKSNLLKLGYLFEFAALKASNI